MFIDLTPELEALIPVKREEWAKVGLSTEPADRERAECGLKMAYKEAGLEPTKRIIWVDSPLVGCLAAIMLNTRRMLSVDYSVREQIWSKIWSTDYYKAGGLVRYDIEKSWDEFKDKREKLSEVHAKLRNENLAQILSHIRREIGYQSGYSSSKMTWDSIEGQHKANSLALYDFLYAISPKAVKPLRGIMEVARSAGWWWPFENAAVISERPVELHLDPNGRLHNTEGMALRYPDGFGVYAINGVRIHEWIFMRPETITIQDITNEPNAEMRRVMCERYGYGRYLADVGAVQVNTRDKFIDEETYRWDLERGKLWRADIGEDEPLVMVEVANSTSEPDGSRKTYFLRVPNEFETAHAAVAWTFGLEGCDYRPKVET